MLVQPEHFGPPAQGEARHRFAVVLTIFLVVPLVGSALLIPWLYDPIRAAAEWLGVTADPFPRYIQRLSPIIALLLLIANPFTGWTGLKNAAEIGLVWSRGEWKKFIAGFLVALLALAALCFILMQIGALTLRDGITFAAVLHRLTMAVCSALAVAVMEEIIYRGTLLTLLARVFEWPTALVLSSLIFSFSHFMARADYAGPLTWDAGLALLPTMLAGMLDFQNMGAAVATLFFAGLLLGMAYGRTGTLYLPIGLHAGAIVSIKMSLAFTTPTETMRPWWESGVLIDGWGTCAVMVLAVVAYGCMGRAPSSKSVNSLPVRAV